MQRTAVIFFSLAIIFSFSMNASAQKDAAEDISIVLPAQSIQKFLTRLVPFQVNMGKYLSGSLWIKSITGFRIGKNKISFASHLYGEGIAYTTKIGQQLSTIEFGSVDLLSDWEGTLRFDADTKILYIRPRFKEHAGVDMEKQKGTVVNTLFRLLSDIEYPINLQSIDPVTAELLGNSLTINFEVSNIAAADNKLTVTLKPIPHKRNRNKTPAAKTS